MNASLKALQERLYRYIFRLVREQQLAQNILQEVFIRIYRDLGCLRMPELFRPEGPALIITSGNSFLRFSRALFRTAEHIFGTDSETLKNYAATRLEPQC